MSPIVVDTGPLVAASLVDDPDHERCVAFFDSVRQPVVIPDLVIPEVCYLLGIGATARTEAEFLRSFERDHRSIEHVGSDDLSRIAELVERYADLRLGTVDAAVIAVAERLGAADVATLDRRHFTVVRPRHVDAFTLLP